MNRGAASELGRASPFDWLKTELAAAVAMSSGIMLVSGYALTWARLANDELPTETVLSALPRMFFVSLAIKSVLSPLAIVLVLGSVWVVLTTVILRHPARWSSAMAGWPWARWLVFGVLLSIVCWIVAASVNTAGGRGSSFAYWATGSAIALALTGVTTFSGPLVERQVTQRYPEPGRWWRVARAIAAITIVLCFLSAMMLRVADARFADRGLPQAGVLMSVPCAKDLTGGEAPASSEEGSDFCSIGGFYLGESDRWVFLVQPRACASAGQAHLVTLATADIAQMVIVRRGIATNC